MKYSIAAVLLGALLFWAGCSTTPSEQAYSNPEPKPLPDAELASERNSLLVRASQLETEKARAEAEQARLLFAASAEDAERQRREKEQALQQGAESARSAEMAMASEWFCRKQGHASRPAAESHLFSSRTRGTPAVPISCNVSSFT